MSRMLICFAFISVAVLSVLGDIENIKELSRGVCNGQNLVIECRPLCSIKLVYMTHVGSGNEFGHCYNTSGRLYCRQKENYNVKHDSEGTLYITNLTMEYQKHVRKWSCNVQCMDNSIEEYPVLVTPCYKGFMVNIQHNVDSTYTVSVNHIDFHFITVLELRNFKDKVLATCTWDATSKKAVCVMHSKNYLVEGTSSGFFFRFGYVEKSEIHKFAVCMGGQCENITVTPINPSIVTLTANLQNVDSSTGNRSGLSVGLLSVVVVILCSIAIGMCNADVADEHLFTN